MSVRVQDHIHLSTALGSAPENSPNLTWKARDREEIPMVYIDMSISLEGNVYSHVIGDDTPIQRTDYDYEIKIIGDNTHDAFYYRDLLKSLNGRECYLVDHYHPDNSEDHTVYVERVIVSIGKIPMFTPGLHIFYIPVTLRSLEN